MHVYRDLRQPLIEQASRLHARARLVLRRSTGTNTTVYHCVERPRGMRWPWPQRRGLAAHLVMERPACCCWWMGGCGTTRACTAQAAGQGGMRLAATGCTQLAVPDAPNCWMDGVVGTAKPVLNQAGYNCLRCKAMGGCAFSLFGCMGRLLLHGL